MTEKKTPVCVTVAVNVGGETKTFEADASTANDAHDVALGLLDALNTDAGRWLRQAGRDMRGSF